jgi:succinyl-CoA synthetase beta subunit
MNLHEYQSKQIMAQYGLPILRGVIANSVERALSVVSSLRTTHWMVKAQVHAGGRGKAGGVKRVDNKTQLAEVARGLLHMRLVTAQTDTRGQPIETLLIEETCEVEKELYLGLVIDRSLQRVVFIASTEGGIEIEKVAQQTPEKIVKLSIDPFLGVVPYQCRQLGYKLALTEPQIKQLTEIVINLYRMFVERDLNLVEINPLVITKEGDLLCLDAKINVDDNALYRQGELRTMRDPDQEDPREKIAREKELNYVHLDGDIGCMVNGAGLAMATMDIIKLHGGDPANFLDVGGGATEARVKEAFKIILADSAVKAVLVNIFGGIVRCDLIAQGIVNAVSEVAVSIPVVVRLEGNHAQEASQILSHSSLNIIVANSLYQAAEEVVRAASGKK